MTHKISIAYFTHHGVKGYDNQDSILIDETLITHDSMRAPKLQEFHRDTLLLAVADGISSSKYSALASKMALESLKHYVATHPSFSSQKAIAYIQDQLSKHAIIHPEHRGMGTTLAGLYFEDGYVAHFNTGDSRVYRISKNTMVQLSKDHTQAQLMLDRGEITVEEFESCSDIYSMLEGYLVAGEMEDDELLVHSDRLQVKNGDLYFICTDGVTDTLKHDQLQQLLTGTENIDQKASKLIDAVMPITQDNLSFIIIGQDVFFGTV